MQIFFSHSSKQKPLVREIVRNFPEYLGGWIDEQKLLFGDDVPISLEKVIKSETDYVLVFIDEYAAASTWVAKELAWTLEAERANGRTILLPIVIDENAFRKISNVEVQNRKYLTLKDYAEGSIRALASAITSELFALVCRDMDGLRNRKTKVSATISDADALLRTQAALIQKAVFPHRHANPITLHALRDVVNSQNADHLGRVEFEQILSSIIRHSLIPGLYYDGFELYLVEEHARWKAGVHHDRKEIIGRKASSLIGNGTKVFLDAGSTTAEVASVLCKKIENRVLMRITIATTSISIANTISECCVKMGFDDAFSAVELFVPGGQVRPGTQAIVAAGADSHQILRLADHIGGFDIGLVGVNGVDLEGGFTTHSNAELTNKQDIMRSSKTRYLLGDSSKIGIVLEERFADFSDDVRYVVDNDPDNERLRVLLACQKNKIILA